MVREQRGSGPGSRVEGPGSGVQGRGSRVQGPGPGPELESKLGPGPGQGYAWASGRGDGMEDIWMDKWSDRQMGPLANTKRRGLFRVYKVGLVDVRRGDSDLWVRAKARRHLENWA